MEDERCSKMGLQAFLLLPMQRITRYPLLLSKLLSHTSERHADRKLLRECMDKLGSLLDEINAVCVCSAQTCLSSYCVSMCLRVTHVMVMLCSEMFVVILRVYELYPRVMDVYAVVRLVCRHTGCLRTVSTSQTCYCRVGT